MGFNSAFKGLILKKIIYEFSFICNNITSTWHTYREVRHTLSEPITY